MRLVGVADKMRRPPVGWELTLLGIRALAAVGGNAGEGATPEIAEGDSKSRLWVAVPGEGRTARTAPRVGEVLAET